jgi:hypothetical protein
VRVACECIHAHYFETLIPKSLTIKAKATMMIQLTSTAMLLLLGLLPIVAAKNDKATSATAVAGKRTTQKSLRGLSDNYHGSSSSSSGWCWEEHDGYVRMGGGKGHEGTDYIVYLYDGSDGSHYFYEYEYHYEYGYENGGDHKPEDNDHYEKPSYNEEEEQYDPCPDNGCEEHYDPCADNGCEEYHDPCADNGCEEDHDPCADNGCEEHRDPCPDNDCNKPDVDHDGYYPDDQDDDDDDDDDDDKYHDEDMNDDNGYNNDRYEKPSYEEPDMEHCDPCDNEHQGGSTEDLYFVVPLDRKLHAADRELWSDEMMHTGVWCRNACNNVEWCKVYEYWPEGQRCELWTHWTGYTDEYNGFKCYVKTPCR